MAADYLFVDEWDVDAPQERVFDALADARTYADGKVHVRFDWHVFADRTLLRVLPPVLRPLSRWNHGEAIRAAMRGLEPYAREGEK